MRNWAGCCRDAFVRCAFDEAREARVLLFSGCIRLYQEALSRGPQCDLFSFCTVDAKQLALTFTESLLLSLRGKNCLCMPGLVARGGLCDPGDSGTKPKQKNSSQQFARMAYLRRPEAMERYLSRKPDVVRCSIKDRLVEIRTPTAVRQAVAEPDPGDSGGQRSVSRRAPTLTAISSGIDCANGEVSACTCEHCVRKVNSWPLEPWATQDSCDHADKNSDSSSGIYRGDDGL